MPASARRSAPRREGPLREATDIAGAAAGMPPGPALARAAGAAARRGLSRLGMGLLDAVLPPHCLTCEAEVAAQGTLCPACFAGLSFVTAPLCARCGVPFPHVALGLPSPEGLLCPACYDCSPPFDAARAALR